MSYSQTLINSDVKRTYYWYVTNSEANGSVLPEGLNTPFYTSSEINDINTISKIAVQSGHYDKYIWCKMVVSCPGYTTNEISARIGKVKKVTVNCTTNFANTEDVIKVASSVTVGDGEITPSYTPDAPTTEGDNTTDVPTSYSTTLTRTYKWYYSDSATAPTSETPSSSYTFFKDSQTCNIPLGAMGKYIYCIVSYSISDTNNYVLSKTFDVKAYKNKVAKTTLTLTLGDYSYNDKRQDNVKYGIHDEIVVSVVSATDGINKYNTADELNALKLGNWEWTWKTNDGVTVSGATTSNNGLTSTLLLAQDKSLVGKQLTASVTASSAAYDASGTKGSSYSTDIKKANITITIPAQNTLVYGDEQNIISGNVTTNDVDITQANVYFSVDTPLTTQNYLTVGKLNKIPTNVSTLNAYENGSLRTHTLYVYYPGDDDHNEADKSLGFTISRASRVIKIKSGNTDFASGSIKDVTYGESATFTYVVESKTNVSQPMTIKANQSNLESITISGTSVNVNGNATNTLTTGSVTKYIDADTTITISGAQTDNYNAVSANIVINTQQRPLSIAKSVLDDTTPVYGEEITVTRGEFLNKGFTTDSDASIASVSYQWYEASGVDALGTPITSATSASYTPTSDQADNTKAIYCVITYALNTEPSSKGGNYTLSTTTQTVRTTAIVAKRTMALTLELSGNATFGQLITSSATVTDNTANTKNPTNISA